MKKKSINIQNTNQNTYLVKLMEDNSPNSFFKYVGKVTPEVLSKKGKIRIHKLVQEQNKDKPRKFNTDVN